MTHWATELIGRPWVAGGTGPEAFDCYGLVRFVSEKIHGRELPIIPVDASNLRACLAAFRHYETSVAWTPVQTPIEGDVVLLGNGSWGNHCGVWLAVDGGGVLHAERGCGVVYTPPRRLPWSWRRYYRFNDDPVAVAV